MPETALFPDTAAARTRFVLERRGGRRDHDPWHHQGVIVEPERGPDGCVERTATIFLTGRECPWHCTMCDLWMHTIREDTPPGAIPAQIREARRAIAESPDRLACVKLYNAGSFFDPRAVPEADYDDIADAVAAFARVIVESHPALVGPRVDRWLEALARHGRPALEVAMGLETAHPEALDRLNKGFTLDEFRHAAAALDGRGVGLRVFLLISPPFVPAPEQDAWLLRSIDTAFDAGATAVSIIPTRRGNGSLEALAEVGLFSPPSLSDIERSLTKTLARGRGRGRVFADLWDLERFATCSACTGVRRARLLSMNLTQVVVPPTACDVCGFTGQ
jgi:archaeosine synthase beta-subunit